MTFNDFKNLLSKNFDINHHSDIAREFNVSPQVVNNWKKRDQVPYKYVKRLKEIIEKNEHGSAINNNLDLIKIIEELSKNKDFNDDKPLSEDLRVIIIYIISVFKKNYKLIIASSLFIPFLTAIYVLYYAPVVYNSNVSFIPLGGGNGKGSVGGIASQFGLSLKQGSEGANIGSVNLIPDLVSSRTLHHSLLERKFKTKNLINKISLLEILYGSNEDFLYNKNFYLSLGSDYLKSTIKVTKGKKNDIIYLDVAAKEAQLSADIALAVVEELDKVQKKITLSNVREKLSFINNRMITVNEDLVESEEKLKNFRVRNRNIEGSPALLLQQDRLIREQGTLNSIYTTLKSQFELKKIEEIGSTKLIQIIDEPVVPIFRTSPKRTKSVINAAFAGFIFSIFFIYFRDFYQDIKKFALNPA
jgi:uncharacterized protein involved in exopolysaccharide biosynthesis